MYDKCKFLKIIPLPYFILQSHHHNQNQNLPLHLHPQSPIDFIQSVHSSAYQLVLTKRIITFHLLLVDNFRNEVMIVLFLEIIQCLLCGSLLLQLLNTHLVVVKFARLGVTVLQD